MRISCTSADSLKSDFRYFIFWANFFFWMTGEGLNAFAVGNPFRPNLLEFRIGRDLGALNGVNPRYTVGALI